MLCCCVSQLLLERGAHVEGSARPAGEESVTETPLQLAAASGHYELAALLLAKGADPYLNTAHRGPGGAAFSPTGAGAARGGYSAFALAAAHGHR